MELCPAFEKVNHFFYRYWFFLDKPLSLGKIRNFLEKVLKRLGDLRSGLVPLEGIPALDLAQRYNLRYIPLPLGLSPLTLERSLFLNEEGKPYPDQLEYLRKLTPFPATHIEKFDQTLTSFYLGSPAPSSLKVLQKLRQNCHLLDYVIAKAEAGKSLSREEKLAIVLTVGFLENGAELVHQILSQTPDYSYGKVKNLLKNLPPHPVSCLKLELWLKEISALEPCYCVFQEKLKNRYPSPLLHINPELVPAYNEIKYKIDSPEKLIKAYLRQQEKLLYFKNLLKDYLISRGISTLKVKSFIVELKGEDLEVKKL
jgi:hypothetical protein